MQEEFFTPRIHAALNYVAPETLLVTTTVCTSATSVAMTGPWWSWDPTAGPVAADNGDGTWTFTFDPAPTDNMEYLLVVDGVQEDLVSAGAASDDWSCTPITDYYSYANRQWTVGSGDVSNTFGTCGPCVEEPTNTTPSSLISDCSDFTSGPSAWPYVLVATTVTDGAVSQGAQTYTMNVSSLPTDGANFRVYKTTANGNDFFATPVALMLGENSITVAAVDFDRAVKFQFSSGDVEFDALSLNG
jgi:hypothetical protein